MTSQDDYAYMSQAAYNPAQYQQNLPDYYIDNSLSTADRTVYVNKTTGKATIAFRGTDTHNKSNTFRDIGADISIAFGMEKYNHRFKNSLNATNATIAKYGKDNVTVTGHSLGGSEAMYVSSKTGVKGTVFNPGTSIIDVEHQNIDKAFKHKNDYQNINIDVMPGDPISSLSLFYKGVHKKANYNPLIGLAPTTASKLYEDYQLASAASKVAGPEAGIAVGLAALYETAKQEGPKYMALHNMTNFIPAKSAPATTPDAPSQQQNSSTNHRFTAQQLESEYNAQ